MTRKKKPSGRLSKGPWTYDDIRKVLESQGYTSEKGAAHPQWRHPTRPGKVSLDKKWTSVKTGQMVFDSLARQTGYGKKGLQRLLNGLPAEAPEPSAGKKGRSRSQQPCTNDGKRKSPS